MTKKIYLLLCAVLLSSVVYAQMKSLTIDSQTPGWLSSKINYGDQRTLENLTVTGYINGSDIKFIRNLVNLNLHGVIDLQDANIVSGGEPYYSKHNIDYYTQDNTLTDYMFAYLDSIQKLLLPKSIEKQYSGGSDFAGTYIDTLVINGTMKSETLIICKYNDGFTKIRCLYIPEGVKRLWLESWFHSHANLKNYELFLPSTIEYIGGESLPTASSNFVLHSISVTPEIINSNIINNHGTVYVPKGTKKKYQSSIFRNMTIIEDVPIDSISFVNKNIYTYVGEQIPLETKLFPADAVNKNISYESNNEEVVTIEGTKAIAKKYGNAMIVAYSYDRTFKDTCYVQVYEHTESVKIEERKTIKIGEKAKISANTIPLNTTDNQLLFSSANKQIVEVNDNGEIVGMSKGVTLVTAKSKDGGHTAECVVIVTQPVEQVQLSEHRIEVNKGHSRQLNATILPSNADNKTLQWSSSDKQILNVDEKGVIEALKSGCAYVKVLSLDNPTATDSCLVVVAQPVKGITLNHSTYTFKTIGESLQLIASVFPEDATNKGIKWKSSNESVCIVSDGTVTAMGYGAAMVIATSLDGGYMAECMIYVAQSVEQIQLTEHRIEMNKGDSRQLNTTILPSNADNKTLQWSSSDWQIVRVDEYGFIEAMNSGTAYVKVVSMDNPTATDSCLVVVRQPVEGIALDYATYTFKAIGESLQLTAALSPENATNKEVKWKSSNESVCIVSNGTVVALGYGTAVIIATSVDGGYMATCVITVEQGTAIDTNVMKTFLYKVYNMQGIEIPSLKKGINIVRFNDGMMIKVFVK